MNHFARTGEERAWAATGGLVMPHVVGEEMSWTWITTDSQFEQLAPYEGWVPAEWARVVDGTSAEVGIEFAEIVDEEWERWVYRVFDLGLWSIVYEGNFHLQFDFHFIKRIDPHDELSMAELRKPWNEKCHWIELVLLEMEAKEGEGSWDL